jgi:hypothetical protein
MQLAFKRRVVPFVFANIDRRLYQPKTAKPRTTGTLSPNRLTGMKGDTDGWMGSRDPGEDHDGERDGVGFCG